MDSGTQKDTEKIREVKQKSKSAKIAAGILTVFMLFMPVIIVVLIPLFAVNFLSDKITEFTDWVSWWGADYTLDDFEHESKDGTVSYYPTETDFADLAIKAELRQLSLNLYRGHAHTGEHLTLSEAIAPFDSVYADTAVELSEAFKSSYANSGNAIVTNDDYYNLTRESIMNDLTEAGENNDLVMWSEGQVYDEYLGIYGKINGADHSGGPANVRSSWRKITDEGDTPEIYNLLSQWMYSTFRVDDTRFITDEQQQEKYGNTAGAYRETAATPGTNPLYYITRKNTSGSHDGTDSTEAGGNNCNRLVMTNTLAKKTANFLATGSFDTETMAFGDFNGSYANLIAETVVNNDTGETKPVIGNNRGKFLSLEIIDPDEEINGRRIPPVRYNPIVMADMDHVVGLATISDVFGNLNGAWYCDSAASTITKDTLQNVSGFYVYRDNNGQDHICYSGGKYDSAQRLVSDTHGYSGYEQWNVPSTEAGWNSVWNDNAGSLKTAVKSEFQKKFNEAMENDSVESQPFVAENAARQTRIDEEKRIYEDTKKAAENEYNDKLNRYKEEQDRSISAYLNSMTNLQNRYNELVAQANNFTIYEFNQQAALDDNWNKYSSFRNYIMGYCLRSGVSFNQAARALDNALKYYRGTDMSQYYFNIYDREFKSYIDLSKVAATGQDINNVYIYYGNYEMFMELKQQAEDSSLQYERLMNQIDAVWQQYNNAVEAYNNKAAEVSQNVNQQAHNLAVERDNKINAAAAKRDRNIENIKNEPFSIKLKTKVIWYDTAGNRWYGNISGSKLLNVLRNYSQEYPIGSRYPNIQSVVYSYGEVNTTDRSGSPNVVSFHAQYRVNDGTVKTLPENRLICYRIVYQDSLMSVPATRNNRYNFSMETDDSGALIHGANAKPVTNEKTLTAAMDLFDDYDNMEGNSDMDPDDPDYEYADGYTLKEMLTNKTWISPKNNWRILFELESDPVKEIDK